MTYLKYIFALFFLAPSLAFADCKSRLWQCQGEYTFRGDVVLEVAIQYEVVHVYSQEDQKHLEELQSQGYTCELRMRSSWVCKYFNHQIDELPQDLKDKLLKEHIGHLNVSLGTLRAPPKLISKGDYLTQWEMAQDIKIDDQIYEKYNYLKMGSDLEKINVGEPSEGNFIEFLVTGTNELSRVEPIRKHQSRQLWTEYLVRLVMPGL